MEPDMTAKPEEMLWFESTISENVEPEEMLWFESTISENVEPEVSFVEQEKEEASVSCTWY